MNAKTEFQNAAIKRFMFMTGCLTRHVAIAFLESEEWDVEAAVIDYNATL